MGYLKKMRCFLSNQFNLFDTESFYDKYADKYKEIRLQKGMLFNDYIELPAIMSEIKKFRNKPKKILDIGCGTGFYTRNLIGIAQEITAIDISQNMLDLASEHCRDNVNEDLLNKINFVHTSLEQYKAPKKYFDLVLGTFMLGYFNNLDVFFSKIKNMISDNGKLIVSTLHPFRMYSEKKKDGYHLNQNYFNDGYYESDFLSKEDTLKLKRWTFEEISHFAFKNGFLIEQQISPKPISDIPKELKEDAEYYKKFPSILIVILRRK